MEPQVFYWKVEDLTYFQLLKRLTTQPKKLNGTTINIVSDWGEEILNELNEFAIRHNITLLDPNKEA